MLERIVVTLKVFGEGVIEDRHDLIMAFAIHGNGTLHSIVAYFTSVLENESDGD